MTRSSRASSGIQRIAGGEMAVAMLVFEWACEVVAPNFRSSDPKEYGNPVSSVIRG